MRIFLLAGSVLFALLPDVSAAGGTVEPSAGYSRRADFREGYRRGALDMCRRMTRRVNRNLPTGELPARPGVKLGQIFSAGGYFPQFFLWDTCFNVMWARHFPEEGFPVESALDNFYKFQEPSGYICREIFKDGTTAWKERHPIGLNPPLLAWAELEAERSGATTAERLRRVFPNLERFHAFYRKTCRRGDGLYFSTIFGCGMDDLPRWPIGMAEDQLSEGGIVLGREDLSEKYAKSFWDDKESWVYRLRLRQNWNRQAGWIDTSAQMAFDCLNLAAIADILGETEKAKAYRAEHDEIAAAINANCWDETRGFYFDCWEKGIIPRYHVGAFWTLIAKVAPPDRAKRMLDVLFDEKIFWCNGGIASLGKNDPDYDPRNTYWKGSVWPPTVYMTILGLKANGFSDEADRVARRWYDACARLWDAEREICENIQPDDPRVVRDKHMGCDWCGWSALAPLALPIEMGWERTPRGKPGEWPFATLRCYGSYVRNKQFCERVFAAQERHPGLFEEIWFCDDCSALDSPERCAEMIEERSCCVRERCRRLGIGFSIQAYSVNHDPDDRRHEGFPDDAWIVDRTGRVRQGVFCCNSPSAADFVRRRTGAILAKVRPDAFWPDDDLRLVWKCGNCPSICFCDRCISLYNARFGRALDRASLLAALDGGPGASEIRREWSAFNGESLGRIAKVIGDARDETSPETRLGIQFCTSEFTYEGEAWKNILTGLAGKSGEAGIRPGGGCWSDYCLKGELPMKLIRVARETERSGRLAVTRQMCYEIENWPHVAAQKNPNGMMAECAAALAAGCNSIAFYWGSDLNGEDDSVYDYWLGRVAAWRPYHLAIRTAFRGTSIGGVAAYLGEGLYALPGNDWVNLDDPEIGALSREGVPAGVIEGMPDAFWLNARAVRTLVTNDLARVFSGAVLTDVLSFDLLARKFPALAFTHKIGISEIPAEKAPATALRESGYERFPSGRTCENVKAAIRPLEPDVVALSEMTAFSKTCGTCIVPTEFGGKVVVAQDVPAHMPHGQWPGCRRHAILDGLDAAVPGGMPARLLTDGYSVSLTVRKTEDGRTAGVFLLNYGSGETPPLELAIRRGAGADWRIVRPDLPDVAADTVRSSSSETVLRIPGLPAFGTVLVCPGARAATEVDSKGEDGR